MMCGSVSFAQKQHVECPRDTSLLLYFEYISEPVIFHFYLSKEVKSVLLPESSTCTSTWVKNVCTFATTALFALGML